MSGPPSTPEFPDELYARFLFYAEADLRSAERILQPSDGFWHEPARFGGLMAWGTVRAHQLEDWMPSSRLELGAASDALT
jgi:hypothetical protein